MAIEAGEPLPDLFVAPSNELLVMPPSVLDLPDDEVMFLTPAPAQAADNRVLAVLDVMINQGDEHLRITLVSEDGVEDARGKSADNALAS